MGFIHFWIIPLFFLLAGGSPALSLQRRSKKESGSCKLYRELKNYKKENMKLNNFFKKILKGTILFWGIFFAGLLTVMIIYWFKPHRVTVAGIPEGFTEKQFRTGDVTLNYVEGPEKGTPVLLIPGQMESWQGYKQVMGDLARTYHVYIVDVRGQGKSTHTPGNYSYNICGNDLREFLKRVVKKPAIVSGLSSGAVLSVWLGANAPEMVLGVIAEDPPMYSSIWPRIKKEKFMTYGFYNLISHFKDPRNKDMIGYLAAMGVPKKDSEELNYLPLWLARLVNGIYEFNKKYRPDRPEDPPYLPLQVRFLYKYISEYDVDFSKATVDGRLSKGFNPDETLKKIRCPMLLMHASWSRDKYWGILGAMDDKDAERIQSLVKHLEYARVESSHDIHVSKPERWLKTFHDFAGKPGGKLKEGK